MESVFFLGTSILGSFLVGFVGVVVVVVVFLGTWQPKRESLWCWIILP